MIRAEVQSWTDGHYAETFIDDDGRTWLYWTDDMAGRIAVHRDDGKPGILTWDTREDCGWISFCEEGDTFDVNCEGDHIVCGGEWIMVG